ncbi:hypothetical protein LCGC14_2205940 [marine sediment metagenome]|uniref:Uncharacterized protein n=1 Tax=marine sediment metagenome TaxID=412755 RepID=A0A0F9DF71_9ZZZZ
MGSSGTALGIIGIIIAAGAIGFAFFVWNGQNTTNSDLDDVTDQLNDLESDFNSLTKIIVIGIWDDLDRNQDYAPHNLPNDWLFEFGDNKLNNTDYISVSNTNTRIILLQPGWYRIHISVLLGGISPSNNYWVRLFKDGAIESHLDFYSTSSTSDSSWHYIDSSAFVYSDGTNYIEINAFSSDDFSPSTNDDYNRFMIEYVVQ